VRWEINDDGSLYQNEKESHVKFPRATGFGCPRYLYNICTITFFWRAVIIRDFLSETNFYPMSRFYECSGYFESCHPRCVCSNNKNLV